jgi:Kdo2-lipid IVA lauroyltransferase/acyltransferase
VALLMDQNILPRDGGAFVDFFGLPVPVSQAVFPLAARTGAPVAFAYCVADEQGRYTVYLSAPVSVADLGATPLAATQRVAAMSEAAIRQHPGCWLWMYRRWKWVPPERGLEGYPFYARHYREQPPATAQAKRG